MTSLTKKDTQRTNTTEHLPIHTAITQQLDLNKQQNLDNSNINPSSPIVKSPTKKTPLSMSSYLSHKPKKSSLQTDDQQLPKHLENVFNIQLIGAKINRDTVLLDISDCILTEDQARCMRLSKQKHVKRRNLSVNNACILVDNKLAITNILKESVMDVLHSNFTSPKSRTGPKAMVAFHQPRLD